MAIGNVAKHYNDTNSYIKPGIGSTDYEKEVEETVISEYNKIFKNFNMKLEYLKMSGNVLKDEVEKIYYASDSLKEPGVKKERIVQTYKRLVLEVRYVIIYLIVELVYKKDKNETGLFTHLGELYDAKSPHDASLRWYQKIEKHMAGNEDKKSEPLKKRVIKIKNALLNPVTNSETGTDFLIYSNT